MTIIETKNLDGNIVACVGINLTESGLCVVLSDHIDGSVVLVHRDAWADVVKMVDSLFEEKKKQAKTWMDMHHDEDD